MSINMRISKEEHETYLKAPDKVRELFRWVLNHLEFVEMVKVKLTLKELGG